MITKKMSAIDHVSQVASCGAAFCSPTFHHVAKEIEKVMEGRLKLCRGKYLSAQKVEFCGSAGPTFSQGGHES